MEDEMKQMAKRAEATGPTKSLLAVGVVAAALVAVYMWAFYGHHAPANKGEWGQLGDFIGGVLNPIVAGAALYWLTQSVKLQKAELAETRAELGRSADAQVDAALASALNARLTSIDAELALREPELAQKAAFFNQYKRHHEAGQRNADNRAPVRRVGAPAYKPAHEHEDFKGYLELQMLVEARRLQRDQLLSDIDTVLGRLKHRAAPATVRMDDQPAPG